MKAGSNSSGGSTGGSAVSVEPAKAFEEGCVTLYNFRGFLDIWDNR